jgi:hypothetical protein
MPILRYRDADRKVVIRDHLGTPPPEIKIPVLVRYPWVEDKRRTFNPTQPSYRVVIRKRMGPPDLYPPFVDYF